MDIARTARWDPGSMIKRAIRWLRPSSWVSVDPRGPVFISYRQSDGRHLATETAWALRAAGVPVWQDDNDLPPGDTSRRLAEALSSGLSGAVLLVTEEIAESQAVREIELPRLLRLARVQTFTLSIASTIERKPNELDYEAPDRLLRQPTATLRRIDQQPVQTRRDRAAIARAHARRRMEAIRAEVAVAGAILVIDVQTRMPPFAERADADLVLRLRPPLTGDRRPNREGLEDLRLFLEDLPDLVARAGAEHLRIRGGAHLSVAFALGATLPTTFRGQVDVLDTGGQVWSLHGNADPGAEVLLDIESQSDGPIERGPVLLFLDLLPTRSDDAFHELAEASQGTFASIVHLRAARTGNLEPAQAAALVGQAAERIRALAGKHGSRHVHLLLRCPWNVALLLGRTLNTLRIYLYEWEDGPDDGGLPRAPRYLPSLIVRSGGGGSPIEDVALPVRPHADGA